MGESENAGLKLHFDRHLRLEFRGAKVTTDAGLLAVKELDEVMGLTEMAGDFICEARTGRNVQHELAGLLKQSVYARLAGYEDVNDQEALTRDPAMRAVVGKKALERNAASSQTASRFETEILDQEKNTEALTLINSVWVDKAVSRSTNKKIVLDMDSSEFPVHGTQEGSAYNGHFGSRCYHPLLLFNQLGIVKELSFGPAMFTPPMDGRTCSNRSSTDIKMRARSSTSAPTPPSLPPMFTSTWRRTASSTQSGSPQTRTFKER